uniref:SCP domain-containing protein n=1 Tax=Kwoniella pini CBS 10737 TaxID=1296096 RepID=A0A1B9HYV2_9TREE|nr:uncharacterized protein I206_05238 [Kwoniella pini CBS 10737]OCF48459.1 hypothetical protein I206_05238 [Kwoniella pini CBS 10737]
MLAISSSFALLSLLLSCELISAKPHHSPLERRKVQHRRHRNQDISPVPPSVPLAARKDDNVVYVDVWSTTTVTASSSSSSSAATSATSADDSKPPEVIGAIVADQDGNSPNVVTVDVTSTVIKTIKQGEKEQKPASTSQQQVQETNKPVKTTLTATKAIPTVGAIAISTGKGITKTIQETYTPTREQYTTETALPTNGYDKQAQKSWIDLHNDRRKIYGNVPSLQYRADLVITAKEKAELCNANHTKVAENLQWGDGIGTPYSAIRDWVDKEAQIFDFNNPTYDDRTGHLTQVVWKDSVYVGCWIAMCGSDTKVGKGATGDHASMIQL